MSLLAPLPPASVGVEVSSPPPPTLARGSASSMCGSPTADDDLASATACSSFFGIRGSSTTVRGTPADEGVGIMFSAEGEQFARAGMITIHGSHRIAIGGGGAGFEGALLGGFAGGLRAPIAENHGPLLRAGVFAYMRGNNGFYGSLVELPQLQLGYQYARGPTLLELGMTSGAVLVGRHRTGEAELRSVGGGLEVGAYATVRTHWVRFGANVTRLPTNDGIGTPVRAAEASLCVTGAPLAICADGRATTTDAIAVPGAAPSEVGSLYAGLAFGFGL